ncbi:MAG: hypothetical protein HY289_09250 [Planctomycetes bacterium]|nr:hypothetical protein [Planctomycetota bacterium]
MSTNPAPAQPRRSIGKIVMNTAIACFFAVGIIVSAASFGLFGCWCDRNNIRPDPPVKTAPVRDESVPLPSR